MVLLALDTAASSCAVALCDANGKLLAALAEERRTGHAERLIPMVASLMAEAGIARADLSKIAVSVGPGSFTGVRTAIAAARGLSLALSIPAVGVTTLEAMAADGRAALGAGPILAAIDAGRGEVYAAAYGEDGTAVMEPQRLPCGHFAGGDRALPARELRFVGDGVAALGLISDALPEARTGSIEAMAALGLARSAGRPPEPLYLRSADAKPPSAASRIARVERGDGLMFWPFVSPLVAGFARRERQIIPAAPEDVPAMARIHAQSFAEGWSEDEIERIIDRSNTTALVSIREGFANGQIEGFVIAHTGADEAEILSIAVDRFRRRGGIGWALMDCVMRQLHADRVKALFLEVDEKNEAAIGLYRRLGFRKAGERPGYYRAADGSRSDRHRHAAGHLTARRVEPMQTDETRENREPPAFVPPDRERRRRSVVRVVVLAPLLVLALLPMGIVHVVLTRSPVPSHRYLMPRWWYRFALLVIGMRVVREGRLTRDRPLLLLANHVSWTDIVVLGAHVPGCFVAKADMADWPAIGFLTKFTRSIFVKREDPRTVGSQTQQIGERLRGGEPVILFPEGTTAAGTEMKPFKSSLLGAVRHALSDSRQSMTIQPAALAYVARGGRPMDADERRTYAAWIDDEPLAPHLGSVIFGKPMTVRLICGDAFEAGPDADRKQLTKRAEAAIDALLAKGLSER